MSLRTYHLFLILSLIIFIIFNNKENYNLLCLPQFLCYRKKSLKNVKRIFLQIVINLKKIMRWILVLEYKLSDKRFKFHSTETVLHTVNFSHYCSYHVTEIAPLCCKFQSLLLLSWHWNCPACINFSQYCSYHSTETAL